MKKLLFLTLGITSIATASAYTIADTQTTSQETQNPFYTWTTKTINVQEGSCILTYEIRTKFFLGKPVFSQKIFISEICQNPGDNPGGGDN